mmetsp:Transcript_18874/g.32948  ORF Transcript_18874/g.32948 Transcript_18874/m.32948 type:complete len:244 (+) Transcript_18874:596-1327(+)
MVKATTATGSSRTLHPHHSISRQGRHTPTQSTTTLHPLLPAHCHRHGLPPPGGLEAALPPVEADHLIIHKQSALDTLLSQGPPPVLLIHSLVHLVQQLLVGLPLHKRLVASDEEGFLLLTVFTFPLKHTTQMLTDIIGNVMLNIQQYPVVELACRGGEPSSGPFNLISSPMMEKDSIASTTTGRCVPWAVATSITLLLNYLPRCCSFANFSAALPPPWIGSRPERITPPLTAACCRWTTSCCS